MTKNEVKALIRKKMETAERDFFESFAKKNSITVLTIKVSIKDFRMHCR